MTLNKNNAIKTILVLHLKQNNERKAINKDLR